MEARRGNQSTSTHAIGSWRRREIFETFGRRGATNDIAGTVGQHDVVTPGERPKEAQKEKYGTRSDEFH